MVTDTVIIFLGSVKKVENRSWTFQRKEVHKVTLWWCFVTYKWYLPHFGCSRD
jgi:hypothetical protein